MEGPLYIDTEIESEPNDDVVEIINVSESSKVAKDTYTTSDGKSQKQKYDERIVTLRNDQQPRKIKI